MNAEVRVSQLASRLQRAYVVRAVEERLLRLFSEGKLTGTTEGRIVDANVKRDVLIEARERLGLDKDETLAVGDGANDIAMVEEAGLGVGFNPKKALAKVADAVIRDDLSALLWAQGIPRSEWVI